MKRRLLLCSLCVLLLLSALPASAANAADDGETTDFVLVLDASASLDTRQMDICVNACKLFIDMIPIDGARVGVVAFGYWDSAEAYKFQDEGIRDAAYTSELSYVHVIQELAEAEGAAERERIKSRIDTAVNSSERKDKSPVGTAMLAAMDQLRANGAGGRSCVILVSDGCITANEWTQDEENLGAGVSAGAAVRRDNANASGGDAISIAAGQRWPLFCLDLNPISHTEDQEKQQGQALLSYVAEKTDGVCYPIEDINDLAPNFLEIFSRFMRQEDPNVEVQHTQDGWASFDVTLEELTTESNVVVTGEQIDQLILTEPNGTEYLLQSGKQNAYNEDRIVATLEEDYICAKLICPAPGTWQVRVHSTSQESVEVTLYSIPIQNVELATSTDLPAEGAQLLRSDAVSFRAWFRYHEEPLIADAFCAENAAQLVVTAQNGDTETYTMSYDAEAHAYGYVLALGDFEDGSYEASVRVSSQRIGSQSQTHRFSVGNAALRATAGTELPGQSVYVNQHFTLEPYALFANEDADPVTWQVILVGANGQTVLDETYTEGDADSGVLSVHAGTIPGSYAVSLYIRDYGGSELCYTMPLEVVNRPVEVLEGFPYTVTAGSETLLEAKKRDAAELWIDAYFFQRGGVTEFPITLGDGFRDPDGVAVEYSDWSFSQEGLAAYDWDGSTLTLTPLAMGETELTFRVSDGVSAEEEILRVTIPVRVVSGKTVFWATHWWRLALALAALALIGIAIWFCISEKKVRGKCDITFTDHSGKTESLQRQRLRGTVSKKKRSFTLKELVMGFAGLLEQSGSFETMLERAFTETGADKILVTGVVFGKGCRLKGIPKPQDGSPSAVIKLDGVTSCGSLRVKAGTLRLELTTSDNHTQRVEIAVY